MSEFTPVELCVVCSYDLNVKVREPHGQKLCDDCAPSFASHLSINVGPNRHARRRMVMGARKSSENRQERSIRSRRRRWATLRGRRVGVTMAVPRGRR